MHYKFVTQTEFQQELHRLSVRLHLSQEGVATLLDVSPRTVWRWFDSEPVRGFEREGILFVLRASLKARSKVRFSATPLAKKKLATARPAR